MIAPYIGIIGGSGIYRIPGIELIQKHDGKNYFGEPSAPVAQMSLSHGGQQFPFFFIPRHGEHHHLLPSEINYRANIFALKKLGVKIILSVSAVGSLKEDIHPGTFVLPSQFIDWTKGRRERTFFGQGLVAHVSTAVPVEPTLQTRLGEICEQSSIQHTQGGTYICIEGPQFSSKAESTFYRSLGASVIGMTNVPEAYLAKEAGIAYATVAMVTDYDCWKEEHCQVEEIMKVMKHNEQLFHKLVKEFIPSIYTRPIAFHPENKGALMTPLDNLNDQQRQMLEVLFL